MNAILEKLRRPAIPVFVATTVMLSFISFWRAAAIVLWRTWHLRPTTLAVIRKT